MGFLLLLKFVKFYYLIFVWSKFIGRKILMVNFLIFFFDRLGLEEFLINLFIKFLIWFNWYLIFDLVLL